MLVLELVPFPVILLVLLLVLLLILSLVLLLVLLLWLVLLLPPQAASAPAAGYIQISSRLLGRVMPGH